MDRLLFEPLDPRSGSAGTDPSSITAGCPGSSCQESSLSQRLFWDTNPGTQEPANWRLPSSGLLSDRYHVGLSWDDLAGDLAECEQAYLLGRGASGVVYLGRRVPYGRYPKPLALKFVMRDQLPLVQGEILHARDAHHPHIVRVDDVIDLPRGVGWEPAAMVVVMQYCGRSLQAVCLALQANNQCLPASTLWMYLRHLLEGLNTLHGFYKLAHRDINPRNLLVETEDPFAGAAASLARSCARVGDLGTACPIGAAGVAALRQDGFKAPEVVSEDVSKLTGWISDPAQDIYSLGAVAGWAFQFLAPPVSWELRRFVVRCTDPHPERRPSSGELLQEFTAET